MKKTPAVLALAALALISACSREADAEAKARWAVAYTSQCTKATSDANLASYGPAFCTCVAERYVAKFSAVQLPLTLVSKPLKDAAKAITGECALIASMQEEYNRLTAALRAHNELALTAYLTPDFVSTDVRGRSENAEQMLSRIGSRPKARIQTTTVLSVREVGKLFSVRRKSLEAVEAIDGGKRRTLATRTFFSDTWIDSDGAWLLRRSRVDSIETYVDGRSVSKLTSAQSPARGASSR
jgi:Domain of unknown function (DUF4440)